MSRRSVKVMVSVLACVLGLAVVRASGWNDRDDEDGGVYERVLLISIDGLHAVDVDRFVASHPDSTLATLQARGRTYTNATATRPSDSFPGLLAMVTGGTPRSTGVYYDDQFDRSLVSAGGTCVAGVSATGTRVQWKSNLDIVPVTAPFMTAIDATKLPRDLSDCSRISPHQYPRANNVFELVNAARGRTAWADKHPAYQFLNGRSGSGIDDLFAPEIASCDGLLPCPSSAPLLTTNSFAKTMAYDDMKVDAIVNEINGYDHTGTVAADVPRLFGMNFQAVSVGQKLDTRPFLGPILGSRGGYVDAAGTPSAALLDTLEHTDASLGRMVAALRARGLFDSTLIIISAKHGNSPIDPAALRRVDPAGITNAVNAVQPGLLALLSADTGPLIWLKDQSKTQDVVASLKATDAALTGIDATARGGGVLWGAELAALYADPLTDLRTPDIILFPVPGTVYTTSASKIADHGGWGDDDVHVALLVSNPGLPAKRIDDPVETRQIACTILKSLGMACDGLDSQQTEPSKFLPHSNHKNDGDSE